MVKKDLERIGIPYETPDGIADFHAAGRHSHITGLVRSGATIMEAKELARHADIRQTVKYTHIGMKDRAEALAGLPSPFTSAGVDCLHYVCNSGSETGTRLILLPTRDSLTVILVLTARRRRSGSNDSKPPSIAVHRTGHSPSILFASLFHSPSYSVCNWSKTPR